MRAHLWFSLCLSFGLAALGGCIKHKSGYCDPKESNPCGDGGMWTCDPNTLGCVRVVDAATDTPPDTSLPMDGRDGPDGTTDGSVDGSGDGGASADGVDGSNDVAASCADAACPTGQNCGASFKCFTCHSNEDCDSSSGKPICDTGSGLCVACNANGQCGDGGVCDQRDAGTHFTCVGCTDNFPAPDAGAATPDAGAPSLSVPGQCGASKPVCDDRPSSKTINTCIECKVSDNCGGAKPVCDTKTNTCVPCFKDEECTRGPGLCLPSGQCATTDQVIFVQQQAPAACQGDGGASANGTTPDKAYCSASQAVSALSKVRNVIVVLGGNSGPLGGLNLVGQGSTVSTIFILGRNGPGAQGGQFAGTVRGGATDDAGITINNASVFLQDIKVDSSQYLGVRVQDGSLSMDRCLIKGNAGGVQIVTSAFDIRNTIFVGNTGTKDSLSGNASWSDLRVTSLATGPGVRATLINDTFVPTTQSSVSFNTNATPSVTQGLLMVSDDPTAIANAKADVSICCSGSTNTLKLASDFSLTADSSACIDKVLTTLGAVDDYLGKKRPGGASSDCGAFEFFPTTTTSN